MESYIADYLAIGVIYLLVLSLWSLKENEWSDFKELHSNIKTMTKGHVILGYLFIILYIILAWPYECVKPSGRVINILLGCVLIFIIFIDAIVNISTL